MSTVALYTFGLLDPAIEPRKLTDFVRRGGQILDDVDQAPGFLGRPAQSAGGTATHAGGEDYGAWGVYELPDVPSFAGHDRRIHIATLSLWRDLESARSFVYHGFHRDALRIRYNWFLKGEWPGYVLWNVADGVVPRWGDGVSRYEALARDGESGDQFSFGAVRGH
jgi:uncharacterized protein DUF3291